MHRDKMTMFRTLLQIKETQRVNQIINNFNYDIEGVAKPLLQSVSLPPVMTSSVLEVETKRLEQQQKCAQWNVFAVAMRPQPEPVRWKPAKSETASQQLAIQVAWRWKSLLMQTVLLSAVNGSVRILLDQYQASTPGTAKIVNVYTKQGIEIMRNELRGEWFKMTDISETCRWHGKSFVECTHADGIHAGMGLPVPPPWRAGHIHQHSGRMIFDQRIEEGTATLNHVHENTFGDKSFNPRQRLVSETYNSANDLINSVYQSSELSLYQPRLYEEVDAANREAWLSGEDFFNDVNHVLVL